MTETTSTSVRLPEHKVQRLNRNSFIGITQSDLLDGQDQLHESITNLASDETHEIDRSVSTSNDALRKRIERHLVLQKYGPEKDKLEEERARLVDKMFLEEELTKQESRNLRYIRWQLDLIEDAEHGEGLDRLEELVAAHETLSEKISYYANKLENKRSQRKK